LVGHSLGGASAALLAIMLRKKSKEELGFSPDIISAVGFGTPPCISKEAAESCASYVSTVVLQVCLIFLLGSKSGSQYLHLLSCLAFIIELFLLVMQDDVIPRLSAASLARLRNEILKTDW
jgi:pimeloyl-ACP methyl ester carboxylesterase